MILVNGDSFTFGEGLLENKRPWPNLIFDTRCNNIAESGSSNPSIYRRSLEEIYINSYDTLIIAWSSIYRFEWGDNDGKAKTIQLNSIQPSDIYYTIIKELITHLHSEFWYFKQFLMLLSSLRLHCKQLDIKFYSLHSNDHLAQCYNRYSEFMKIIINYVI